MTPTGLVAAFEIVTIITYCNHITDLEFSYSPNVPRADLKAPNRTNRNPFVTFTVVIYSVSEVDPNGTTAEALAVATSGTWSPLLDKVSPFRATRRR